MQHVPGAPTRNHPPSQPTRLHNDGRWAHCRSTSGAWAQGFEASGLVNPAWTSFSRLGAGVSGPAEGTLTAPPARAVERLFPPRAVNAGSNHQCLVKLG
jgi:hypothetical protein